MKKSGEKVSQASGTDKCKKTEMSNCLTRLETNQEGQIG